MNLKMSKKVEQAMAFHDKGYNCAQAVACSFCEEFGIDQETMFRVSEGFGLGMGMMDMCADTFWELYNPENPAESPYGSSIVNSYCHAWSCTPTYLLRKYFN